MTHRLDVARGRDTVARWCAFAEQRLEYLTELFETGRWRRYHSEIAFLENIQEAKTAVETWRDLAMREAARNNSTVDASWLDSAGAGLPRGDALRHQPLPSSPPPAEIPVYSPPGDVATAGPADHVSSDEAPSAPAMNNAPELARSLDAIEQRYPLLRNAL
jgi:uncharacterized repeat protein (TIGR03809 family)